MSVSLLHQENYLSRVIYPQQDFQPLEEKGRPGGSSLDIQYFKEIRNNRTWIGKCGIKAANNFDYSDECKEVLALKLYCLFGVEIPEVGLSPQQMSKQVRDDNGIWIEKVHEPRLHIMSGFLDGFHVLGEDYIENYIRDFRGKDSYYMVEANGRHVPLKGFGAALAVANFLHDYDCIGRSGGNMGYVIDKSGDFARIVKIDAGEALPNLAGHDKNIRHNPQSRDMLIDTADSKLSFEDLSKLDQVEYALTAKKILSVPDSVLKEFFKKAQFQKEVKNGLTDKFCNDTLELLIARKVLFLKAFSPEVQKLLTKQMVNQSEDHAKKVQAKWDMLDLPNPNPNDSQELFEYQLNLGLVEYKVAEKEQKLQKANQIPDPVGNNNIRVFQLFPRNSNFVSRSGQIEALDRQFSSSKDINIACLVGLGGMGKSQLANEYAYQSIDKKKYQHILWLYAEANQLFRQMSTLVEIWYQKKVEKVSDVVKKFYDYLQKQSTLLVLDNVEHQDALKNYLPKLKPKNQLDILITSRYQHWQNLPTFKLDQFSVSETHDYYSKVTGKTCEDIQRLHDILGGLPLAIAQAIVFIKQNEMDPMEYCERFENESSLLSEQADSETKTVSTTLTLAMAKLRSINKNVDPVLSYCAYLSAEDITQFQLQSLLNLPKKTIDEALKLLNTYSIVSLKEEEIKIHRLVQSVMRLIHQKNGSFEKHHKEIYEWVFPQLDYNTKDPKEIYRVSKLIPHGETIARIHNQSLDPIDIVNLWGKMGFHQLQGVSNYKSAKQFFKKAVQICKDEDTFEYALNLKGLGIACVQLGDYKKGIDLLIWVLIRFQLYHRVVGGTDISLERASVVQHLGVAFLQLGDYEEGYNFFDQAVEILEDYYKEDHEDIGVCLAEKGMTLMRLGEYQKAVEALSRAQNIFELKLGNEDPLATTYLVVLSTVLGLLDQHKKSYEMSISLLARYEELYGKEHIQTAMILRSVGCQLAGLGDTKKAIDYLTRALAIIEKLNPLEDPKIGRTLVDLGSAWMGNGDYQKALGFFERGLTILENFYGKNHPKTAYCLTLFGANWGYLGNHQKSLEILNKALVIQEEFYGKEHYEVARVLIYIGSSLQGLGNYKKSIESLTKALEIQEKVYGQKHIQIACAKVSMAHAWGELGDYKKKHEILNTVLPEFEEYYGKDHPQTGLVLNHLGSALTKMGRPDKGLEILTRAREICESSYPSGHPIVGQIMLNLGIGWMETGDYTKALEVEATALVTIEKFYGKDCLEVGRVLINLALIWINLKNSQKALELAARAHEIHQKFYGDNHPDVAKDLMIQGMALASLGDYTKSLELSEKALPTQEEFYGKVHPEVGATLLNIATTLLLSQKVPLAIEYFDSALDVFRKCYPEDNPKLANVLVGVGIGYRSHDMEKSLDFFNEALELKTNILGEEHPEVLELTTNIGNIYLDMEENEEAIEYFERVVTIKERLYGKDHLETAIAKAKLSDAYAETYNIKKQRELLLEAEPILTKNNHPLAEYYRKSLEAADDLINLDGDFVSNLEKDGPTGSVLKNFFVGQFESLEENKESKEKKDNINNKDNKDSQEQDVSQEQDLEEGKEEDYNEVLADAFLGLMGKKNTENKEGPQGENLEEDIYKKNLTDALRGLLGNDPKKYIEQLQNAQKMNALNKTEDSNTDLMMMGGNNLNEPLQAKKEGKNKGKKENERDKQGDGSSGCCKCNMF